MDFKLVSDYVPTGDQPEAIDRISQSIVPDPGRCNRVW